MFPITATGSRLWWIEEAFGEVDRLTSRAGELLLGQDDTDAALDLPAGDALRITSVMPLQTPAGEVGVRSVQYVIAVDGSTWVVNLSTSDLEADGELFDQIIDTFRLLG
ncbi:MAG: hypothetical protein M3527_04050 [Actinomycetota bacterium]|nr:hypothetical protein [Acidimicrobiia bacterium]MDQ3293607.1 hypothetical protein [Actinomycetota bacterium]